jgi:hypothetical protein
MAFDTASVQMDASLAVFSINPMSQAFPDTLVDGTSAAATFTVTNDGQLPSGAPGVQTTGPFSVMTNGCTAAVPSGGSCTITVVFKPQAAGAASGTLDVTTSEQMTTSATLTGTGVAPPPPPPPGELQISPDKGVDFGWVVVKTASPAARLTVTNVGGSETAIDKVGFGGVSATEFAFAGTSCGRTPLKPGDSCFYDVQFQPSTMGPKAATLEVTGNPSGAASVPLQGRGNPIYITPMAHDFGGAKAGGQQINFIYQVVNATDVTILAPTMSVEPAQDPQAPEWRAVPRCAPGSQFLPGPNNSCHVTVQFTPRTVGPKTARLRAIVHSPSGAIVGNASADMSGTGL